MTSPHLGGGKLDDDTKMDDGSTNNNNNPAPLSEAEETSEVPSPEEGVSQPTARFIDRCQIARHGGSIEDLERILERHPTRGIVYLKLNRSHLSRLVIPVEDVRAGYGQAGKEWLKRHPWNEESKKRRSRYFKLDKKIAKQESKLKDKRDKRLLKEARQRAKKHQQQQLATPH